MAFNLVNDEFFKAVYDNLCDMDDDIELKLNMNNAYSSFEHTNFEKKLNRNLAPDMGATGNNSNFSNLNSVRNTLRLENQLNNNINANPSSNNFSNFNSVRNTWFEKPSMSIINPNANQYKNNSTNLNSVRSTLR